MESESVERLAAAHASLLRDVQAHARLRRPHASLIPTRTRRYAFLFVAAFHALLVLLLRIAVRQPESPADTGVLQVDLLNFSIAEPALPEPQANKTVRGSHGAPGLVVPRVQATIPRVTDTTDQFQPANPPPTLFNRDGTAFIPGNAIEEPLRKSARGFEQTIEPSALLKVKRPIKVRPNHFASVWVGEDEQPLHQQLFRRLVFERDITAPWGTRYHCGMVILMVSASALGPAIGCNDIPEKAWKRPETWNPATELEEH